MDALLLLQSVPDLRPITDATCVAVTLTQNSKKISINNFKLSKISSHNSRRHFQIVRFFVAASTFLLCLATTAGTPETIIAAARREAAAGTQYVMEYHDLAYPGGDVPAGTGVCTDLIIRSLRAAGIDLQREVHRDITANWKAYPRNWDNTRPDPNIDHRRCPNLAVWFGRHQTSLSTSLEPATLATLWQPGDIVFFVRPKQSFPWHVAIISDRHAPDGMPMIIDAYPPASSETHRLDDFAPIHSHFRITSLTQTPTLAPRTRSTQPPRSHPR